MVNDPIQPYRCGLDYLRPCLLSPMPLDLGRHLSAADNDGVHLTPEQHALLAELAAEKIRLMQGPAA